MAERRNFAIRQVQLDAFDTMDREEDDAGRNRIAVAQLPDEVVEAAQADTADTNAGCRDFQDRAPELLARLAQRDEHHCAAPEGGLGRPVLVWVTVIVIPCLSTVPALSHACTTTLCVAADIVTDVSMLLPEILYTLT